MNPEALDPDELQPHLGKTLGKVVLKLAVGQLPVAGPLLDAWWSMTAHRFESRLYEILEDLGSRVSGIEARLGDDEQFQTLVFKVLRIANETHEEEKLSQLKNALVNAATSKLAEGRPEFFLALVDRLLPDHLRYLRFVSATLGPTKRRTTEIAMDISFPWSGEYLRAIRTELEGLGLIEIEREYDTGLGTALAYGMSPKASVREGSPQMTNLGREFLAFISR